MNEIHSLSLIGLSNSISLLSGYLRIWEVEVIYDRISFKNSRNIHKRWAASDTNISIGIQSEPSRFCWISRKFMKLEIRKFGRLEFAQNFQNLSNYNPYSL